MDSKTLLSFASGCVVTYSALTMGGREGFDYPATTALTLHFLLFFMGFLVAQTFLNEWKDSLMSGWMGGATGGNKNNPPLVDMATQLLDSILPQKSLTKTSVKISRSRQQEEEDKGPGPVVKQDDCDFDKLAQDL